MTAPEARFPSAEEARALVKDIEDQRFALRRIERLLELLLAEAKLTTKAQRAVAGELAQANAYEYEKTRVR